MDAARKCKEDICRMFNLSSPKGDYLPNGDLRQSVAILRNLEKELSEQKESEHGR